MISLAGCSRLITRPESGIRLTSPLYLMEPWQMTEIKDPRALGDTWKLRVLEQR